jgi:hypothetical protein
MKESSIYEIFCYRLEDIASIGNVVAQSLKSILFLWRNGRWKKTTFIKQL